MGSGSDEVKTKTRFVNTLKDEKGSKFDANKPPLALIPKEFLDEVAQAFGYGAGKYGKYNFTKGIETTRLLDAAMRHLTAFAWGEDNDPESKRSHLGHAGACIAMCLFMLKNHPGLDDRFKKQ